MFYATALAREVARTGQSRRVPKLVHASQASSLVLPARVWSCAAEPRDGQHVAPARLGIRRIGWPIGSPVITASAASAPSVVLCCGRCLHRTGRLDSAPYRKMRHSWRLLLAGSGGAAMLYSVLVALLKQSAAV